MGGHSEKLLTLEEAARALGIPPDDVEGLIRSGRLPSFRLGGALLRLRQSDVEALRSEIARRPDSPPRQVVTSEAGRGAPTLSRPSPTPEVSTASRPATAWDRIVDFFYYNDFYLIAFLIVLVLVAIIVSL